LICDVCPNYSGNRGSALPVVSVRPLRPNSKTPVIYALRPRSDETDRITGLDFGADDYMIKPVLNAANSLPDARSDAPPRQAKPALKTSSGMADIRKSTSGLPGQNADGELIPSRGPTRISFYLIILLGIPRPAHNFSRNNAGCRLGGVTFMRGHEPLECAYWPSAAKPLETAPGQRRTLSSS